MRWLSLLALACTTGCLRRAPTTFELDRRAGHAPPSLDPGHRTGGRDPVPVPLQSTSTLAAAPHMPARIEPVVQRVWVADQLLEDGSWLQGTWMFVETAPARWLVEVDPGGGTFAAPGSEAKR